MVRKILILFSVLTFQSSVILASDCSDIAKKEAKDYGDKYVQDAFEVSVNFEGDLGNFILFSRKYNDEHRYFEESKKTLTVMSKTLRLYEVTYYRPYDFGYGEEYIGFLFNGYNCNLQHTIKLGFDGTGGEAG